MDAQFFIVVGHPSRKDQSAERKWGLEVNRYRISDCHIDFTRKTAR